ncbi:MAG: thermonuclease family protein [Desulfovibrio sp.]|jgi:endonuclease YncB( thermonuclease family)|nr:thermonuclease family protein [Desulfovibrio sp.]
MANPLRAALYSLSGRGFIRFIRLIWLTALVPAFPGLVHGGQLDSYGCHTDRATGRYECLRGQNRGRHFLSQGDMLREARARDAAPALGGAGVRSLGPGPVMETERAGRRRPVTSYPLTVRDVPDGLTLTALPVGKTGAQNHVGIRLYGLDPLNNETKGCESSAADFVRKTVLGKTVEVMASPLSRNRAGQTVAVVNIDGRALQEMLLEAGLARVSPTCGRLRECADWKALEEKARAAGAGCRPTRDRQP